MGPDSVELLASERGEELLAGVASFQAIAAQALR
jgi:hypothetical protein